MEMIRSAQSIARMKLSRRLSWDCFVVTSEMTGKKPIKLSSGIKVLPEYSLNSAPIPQSIFIPPIWGSPEVVIRKNRPLIDWLIEQSNKGKEIIATGTGVCLLAEAGLLNSKIATTHWYYFDQFEKRYPKVNLKRAHFITQDENIICTGSINALVDLTLYFIEREFGKDVSQVIEQHYSHEINPYTE